MWHLTGYERGTLARALPAFTKPIFFLHGDKDPLPWRCSQASAALIPNARCEVITECGHFPWLEPPGCVAQLLERRVRMRGRDSDDPAA